MERADPCSAVHAKRANAVAHLLRRFVRESDGEDVVRLRDGSGEVGGAVGDDARLARTGAGQDEQRPVGVRDGSALRFGQVVEEGMIYHMQVFTTDDAQIAKVRKDVDGLDGVEVLSVLDLAMETHRGGACEVRSRTQIRSNTDLRIVYTPGVARVKCTPSITGSDLSR